MSREEDIDLGIDNLIEKNKNKNNFSNKKTKNSNSNFNYEEKKNTIKQKENKKISKYHNFNDDEENDYELY
jgi:hypothetical protein